MNLRNPLVHALVAAVTLGGCGSATHTTTRATEATREPVTASAMAETGGGTTTEVATGPEELDWLSTDSLRCVRGAEEPVGEVLAGAGTGVRVRARSIAFEREGEPRIVCEASEAPSGRLVLYVEDYGGLSIGVLEGDRLRLADDTVDVVRLPGASTITAARGVHYCPDGAQDCVIAGTREAIEAYVDVDPNGPRSGWDLTTRTITASRLRRSGTWFFGARACGLEIGLRGTPRELECDETTIDERLACIEREARAREEDVYDADSDEELAQRRAALARESAAFQLVLTDGRQELTFPAFDVARLACVDGNVILREAPREFSSVRSYGAVVVREGRISGGHWMSIRDHEEGRSDCGNAWDGVELMPVLRAGAVIGGIVLGAGGRPMFEIGRGDVGEVRTNAYWPGENGEPPRELEESSFAYGDEPVPLALRETPDGLEAIAAATPAPVCSLVVNDADGQTNVRPDPSSRRAPIGTLTNGTVISPAEQRGRWYRIETPVPGWLFAENLDRRCASR